MAIRVLAVGNNNTTQTDHRSLISSLITSAGTTGVRGGLLPSQNPPAFITNVSAMEVGVGPFRAVVTNTVGTGHYLIQSDAQINLTFDPGEAGVIRTDRIILRVYNNPQDGSGLETVALEYLKGQSSGSASALPANALVLWEFPVPAGASSGSGGINFVSIGQDRRIYTTAAGGVIPVANATEMNAITGAYEGMLCWNRAADIIYGYDGVLWRPKGQLSVPSVSGLSVNILNPEDGTIAMVKDTDTLYVYNGTAWQEYPIENEIHVKGLIGTGTTTLTTYADLPAPNTSLSFTKIRSDTRLRVEMKNLLYTDNTSTGVQLGVRINGTDYDIAKGYFTTSAYMPVVGWDYISGINAGTFTVQARWKRFSGAGNIGAFNGISEMHLTVKEVR